MRQIDLTHPNRVPGSEARVARLTRHLLAASAGVRARLDGDCALFLLSPDTRFEDLDYLWGSLFDLLA